MQIKYLPLGFFQPFLLFLLQFLVVDRSDIKFRDRLKGVLQLLHIKINKQIAMLLLCLFLEMNELGLESRIPMAHQRQVSNSD